MNFNWIRTALLAATAMVSLNSFSQDLIARQAPIDRKLKSVDSLALQKQIRAEQSLYPGLDLYPSWNNEFVQAYGNAIVPESYTFDLKGFCMPTEHTRITDVFGYRPRRRRAHYGLDIKVYVGDTIRAAFDGKVRIVKNQAFFSAGAGVTTAPVRSASASVVRKVCSRSSSMRTFWMYSAAAARAFS